MKELFTKKSPFYLLLLALVAFFTFNPELAYAASMELDGANLSVMWIIRFVGMLLSIALGPILVPTIWDNHFGKISAG